MNGLAGGGGSLALDPNDACSSEREQFAASKSYFTNEILSSTLVGAAGGAALGGITAAVTNGNIFRGALIGGGVGAGAGFASGYYRAMSEKYRDRQELASRINADLHTESTEIDHTLATFGRLRQCRFAQAALIKSELRHHQIDRATAGARLAYQRARFDEEVRLAQSYGATMAKRDGEFQNATTQLAQNRPPRRARGDLSGQAQVAATETIPEKRANFDHAVEKAQTASNVAFNLGADEGASSRRDDGRRYA